MKPLIVLLTVFGLSFAYFHFFFAHCDCHLYLAGNIAMSAMLLVTAIGHFKFTKGMSMMLPPAIPLKTATVYLTGVIEIFAAMGLLVTSLRHITSWLLILFFVLTLPANIYSAANKVDYQRATYQGPGMNYLWFRVPLQAFFIAWVWYFGLH